ncbi:MAG TPA: hypothetical protein VFO78_06675 [Candidatus Limnocylindrales bacterium]|nr:hypothetical protein [Candidatus Limnocylindrales bacterium]
MTDGDPESEGGRLGGWPEGEVVARIWATVDLERSVAALGATGTTHLPDDPHLGARVALVRPVGETPIAILEPSTEARLAAWLARHGEGPAGRYVTLAPEDATGLGGAAVGVPAGAALSIPADGPFGRSRLVLGGPPGTPFVVLVERRPGTIGR